jgi:hypothetical protein
MEWWQRNKNKNGSWKKQTDGTFFFLVCSFSAFAILLELMRESLDISLLPLSELKKQTGNRETDSKQSTEEIWSGALEHTCGTGQGYRPIGNSATTGWIQRRDPSAK